MTCLIATMRSGSTAYAEMIAKDDKKIKKLMKDLGLAKKAK